MAGREERSQNGATALERETQPLIGGETQSVDNGRRGFRDPLGLTGMAPDMVIFGAMCRCRQDGRRWLKTASKSTKLAEIVRFTVFLWRFPRFAHASARQATDKSFSTTSQRGFTFTVFSPFLLV